MDLSVVWPAATGIAGVVGGFTASRWGAAGAAASVNQLLQSRIDLLEQDKQAKDQKVLDLENQIRVISDLVTQRAAVDVVQQSVDRIEAKIDALAPSPTAGP